MSETADFEKNTKIQTILENQNVWNYWFWKKTQKSKQYLKIRMSETNDFEKNTKIQTILENQNVWNYWFWKKHKNPNNTWKSECHKLLILKKTQKSKQYLKIRMTETTDFWKTQKSKQYSQCLTTPILEKIHKYKQYLKNHNIWNYRLKKTSKLIRGHCDLWVLFGFLWVFLVAIFSDMMISKYFLDFCVFFFQLSVMKKNTKYTQSSVYP